MCAFHLSSQSSITPRNLCSAMARTVVCCIQMGFLTIGQVAGWPVGFFSLHLVRPMIPNFSMVNSHW